MIIRDQITKSKGKHGKNLEIFEKSNHIWLKYLILLEKDWKKDQIL